MIRIIIKRESCFYKCNGIYLYSFIEVKYCVMVLIVPLFMYTDVLLFIVPHVLLLCIVFIYLSLVCSAQVFKRKLKRRCS